MTKTELQERMVAKTPQEWFLREMQEGFNLSPKASELILAESEACFYGQKKVGIGQQKVILVKRNQRHGRSVKELEKVEVVWTVYAGLEDEKYGQEHGKIKLRQKQVLRLVREATEQNGIATQEDLARILHVSIRTIKRDFKEMRAVGIELITRGYDEGIGRGQTHKREIITRWIGGESYDQLSINTGHSSSSIQRYIQKFMQIVAMKEKGLVIEEIRRLTQVGEEVLKQYLLIYEENSKTPEGKKWIDEQRKRIFNSVRSTRSLKKGV